MQTIPVIEDNVIVRSTITRILKKGGYEVCTAGDGLQGMVVFREETPDLVITDIIMPEQEGIATIRQIRAENPGAEIIAISGGGRMGNIDFLQVALKMGACDVLPKPFDPEELLDRVAACLNAS